MRSIRPIADAEEPPEPRAQQLATATLEILFSLNYQTGQLRDYLQTIARGVSELMHMDWSVVTLCREHDFDQILASSLDLSTDPECLYPLHGTITQTVVETGCSLTVDDCQCVPDYGALPTGYRSYLGVPLRFADGTIIGTICSFHRTPRCYAPEDVRYVELFAERAATAIHNYQLYTQQVQFNETLEAEVARRTAQLEAAQVQLIEQARLAAIGEFTAMIVHEIRNPLTTVEMGLKALSGLELGGRDRTRLQLALSEEERLKHLLNEILLYAKPQVLQSQRLELNTWVSQHQTILTEMPWAQGRHLQVFAAPVPIWVQGDGEKLMQVLINLVSNACEAVPEGDTISLHLEQTETLACLQVHNGGTPISPDILSRLTQPFFSTKSTGNGLGLAIVQRIVEAHGGTLSIESTATAGTQFTVQLPVIWEEL
ncbi:GAF domain-containing protein [Synechococcales cyanobacterium C]|uniref:histidine kinase n=1 Tax=Petrachloros mirabilis ULC683 TaxID=2781853 RepID=A0A8K2A8E1_9CYAN|nr:GAF domain-containing sensor histidine kinase [Petrachloros mirabilis]NCJ07924.1 GAF domain-containing protein [Petrachloros mirabilis ULC683]